MIAAVAQLLANTLQIGAFYVLFSLGFTLVFGVMKIINMAHGEFFAIGAVVASYAAARVATMLGAPSWLAYLLGGALAVLTVLAIGGLVYRFGMRLYVRDFLGSFILSIGVLLILQGVVLQVFGGAPRILPPLVDGTTEILGARSLPID